MNKRDIMRQESMDILLRWLVEHSPGITSEKLFIHAKDWFGNGTLWTQEMTAVFEQKLAKLLKEGYRVTDKQWYPAGHVAEPARKGPPKEDPRQTRMFG